MGIKRVFIITTREGKLIHEHFFKSVGETMKFIKSNNEYGINTNGWEIREITEL